MARKPEGELRTGYTTGACAAAAARAAFLALRDGFFPQTVQIELPRGRIVEFTPECPSLGNGEARAGIVKDAGDDPDVTHGALILVTLRRTAPGSGTVFRAGEGVGTVTRPGLPVPPGEPAINPVPRSMLRDAVEHGDFEIEIAIPGGEELARQTWNPRLGIVGGLSILGNTVIVIEHNMDVIKVADYIIDMGPEGGHRGGTVVCTGTPEEVAKVKESYTGQYLKGEL